MSLSSILSESLKSRSATANPFVLVQSSAAASGLLVLRRLIESNARTGTVILVTALYAPEDLLEKSHKNTLPDVHVLDWTGYVPCYTDEEHGYDQKLREVEDALKASQGSVTVVLDSIDIIDDDLVSSSKTYKFLYKIYTSLRARKEPSRLICHLTSTSRLRPLLLDTSFSPALTHITAHPPVLLTHIASAYLTPPPFSSSSPTEPSPDGLKFWRIFLPLSDRTHEIENLVFGPDGGGGGAADEIVVEVLMRGRGGDRDVSSGTRRRGVERFLEGWSVSKDGPVPLESLESLKGAFRKNVAPEKDAPDPTKNLTFNLNLTETQQASRSRVPLPYEHDGRPSAEEQEAPGQIFYDPDAADDLDEEDPDEDLDI